MATYYEVIFEGHEKTIYGLLEGYLLAKNNDWHFYFSDEHGVKTETMMEVILEWISLKTKLHHVIINEEFFNELGEILKKQKDSHLSKECSIKKAQVIKKASFSFEAVTYGRKYGEELKSLLNTHPDGIIMNNYDPKETINEDGKGVEMYAPEHEYTFEASGTLEGDITNLIEYRQKLDDHPLITVHEITLEV